MQQADRKPAHVRYFSTRQKRRKARTRSSPCQLASLRLRDLNALFTARYGEIMPDDDAGREDIELALHHLASLAHAKGSIESWLDLRAPWLSRAESTEMTTRAIMRRKYWNADSLAWRLGLTMADRTTLGITTIGAVDVSKAERTKRRKAKHRERQRALRLRIKSACAP